MAKKFWTRSEIQSLLETNSLSAPVSYLDRQPDSPDNVILYYRISTYTSLNADDKLHIRKATIQVNHYHKRKLDNIEQLINDNFYVESQLFNIEQPDTDYWGDVYSFDIYTDDNW